MKIKMQINKNSILIGSDFEMFLVDKKGKVMSAIPFVAASKKFPEQTPKQGCCIQHDGVLQECNIPPVRLGEHELFWNNIAYVKEYINEKFARKEGLTLTCCPSAELEADQLNHPEAIESGCEPSYNAWKNGEMNNKCEYAGSNLRVAGGHLHFSFNDADIETCINLMKCFDVFVTIPFLFIDDDNRRRQFYGKAGEMRLCEWGESRGFEARTLSNFWVSDKEYVEYIFIQLEKMFDYFNSNGMDKINELSNDIVSAINDNNKELAGKMCEEFGNLILIKERKWA
jgi:hypothetical protein